jgi:hypothetical protein
MTALRIALAATVLQMAACHSAKTTAPAEAAQDTSFVRPSFVTGPHMLVYRTRADLADQVPIILSADGSTVVSYPAPTDLKGPGGLPLPTELHNGYLLDNRGIGANVAFISLTYSEYAALPEAPSTDSLLALVIDKVPLTELCDCGVKNAFTDLTGQLDQLIDAGKLRKVCKVIR